MNKILIFIVLLFAVNINAQVILVGGTTPTVRSGLTEPIVLPADKKGDTYVITNDGTLTGIAKGTYTFTGVTWVSNAKTRITEVLTLTITGTGANATLSEIPDDVTDVLVYIDGQLVDALVGGGLTIIGTAITLTNANLGYILDGSERVVATYFKQ